MSDRFYSPASFRVGEFVLDGPEAHHLATVRRFVPGDVVILFNGDGNDYPAEIIATDRKRTVLNLLPPRAISRELPFRLEVVAAMPKGDRGDFLVEKLTELGVTGLTPLLAGRSVVQPKDARLENLRHAVIEASKQCGRNVLMRVAAPASWARMGGDPQLPTVKVFLHPPPAGVPTRRLLDLPIDAIRSGGVVFAVGPEGGFTEDEVATAEAGGWVRMSLGTRVLRVETAAIAAVAGIVPLVS